MLTRNAMRVACSFVLALLLAFCAQAKGSGDTARVEDRVASGESTRMARTGDTEESDPSSVLDRFLQLSIFTTNVTLARMDSVWTCFPEEPTIEFHWIAAYNVLSIRVEGDTAIGTAEVVTGAFQEQSATSYYGWIVTPRVRRDTLHWNLIRSPEVHGWKVCGLSREGIAIDMAGTPENIEFRPAGTTWDDMRALFDSIKRAEMPGQR